MREEDIIIQVSHGDTENHVVAFNGSTVEVTVAITEVTLALLEKVQEEHGEKYAEGVYQTLLHLVEDDRR